MDLKAVCEGLPWYGHLGVWGSLLVWEFWLGKTRFGSTIGLIFNPLKKEKSNGTV